MQDVSNPTAMIHSTGLNSQLPSNGQHMMMALYHTYHQADQTRNALIAASIPQASIRLADQEPVHHTDAHDSSLWHSIKRFFEDDDVIDLDTQGHTLLTVQHDAADHAAIWDIVQKSHPESVQRYHALSDHSETVGLPISGLSSAAFPHPSLDREDPYQGEPPMSVPLHGVGTLPLVGAHTSPIPYPLNTPPEMAATDPALIGAHATDPVSPVGQRSSLMHNQDLLDAKAGVQPNPYRDEETRDHASDPLFAVRQQPNLVHSQNYRDPEHAEEDTTAFSTHRAA